jgi:hypothetical protein
VSLAPYETRPALAAWGHVKRKRAAERAKSSSGEDFAEDVFAGADGSGAVSSRVLGTNWSLLQELPPVRGNRNYALPVEFSGRYDPSTWLGQVDDLTIRSRSIFQGKHLARIVGARAAAVEELALLEPLAIRALAVLGWDEARTILVGLPTPETLPVEFPTMRDVRREMRLRRLVRGVLRMLRSKAGRGELADAADPIVVDAAKDRLRSLSFEMARVYLHVRSKVRFHADRAKAQRLRFPRYGECGQGVLVVHCDCGREVGYRVGCQIGRLCVSCRDRLMNKRRARFFEARKIVMRRDRFKLARSYPGGRWSEKHLVLTIPHFATGAGAPTARIEAFWTARHHFGRSLQRYWRKKRARGVEYLRGFEWTPGSDGLGHPHLHVWLWSPFLSQRKVRFLWARALRKAGVSIPKNPTDAELRVRVREVKIRKKEIVREIAKGGKSIRLQVYAGGDDLVGYLESWSVTEYADDGRTVPPWVMAEVFSALEAKRQAQASRGFLKLADRECACRECGQVGTLVVNVFPPGDPNGRMWAEHFGLELNRSRDGPALRKALSADRPERFGGRSYA